MTQSESIVLAVVVGGISVVSGLIAFVVQKKKEKAERDKAEREEKEAERKEAERVEAERKKEADRIEAERQEAERIAAERKEAERVEAERKEAERIEAERIAPMIGETRARYRKELAANRTMFPMYDYFMLHTLFFSELQRVDEVIRKRFNEWGDMRWDWNSEFAYSIELCTEDAKLVERLAQEYRRADTLGALVGAVALGLILDSSFQDRLLKDWDTHTSETEESEWNRFVKSTCVNVWKNDTLAPIKEAEEEEENAILEALAKAKEEERAEKREAITLVLNDFRLMTQEDMKDALRSGDANCPSCGRKSYHTTTGGEPHPDDCPAEVYNSGVNFVQQAFWNCSACSLSYTILSFMKPYVDGTCYHLAGRLYEFGEDYLTFPCELRIHAKEEDFRQKVNAFAEKLAEINGTSPKQESARVRERVRAKKRDYVSNLRGLFPDEFPPEVPGKKEYVVKSGDQGDYYYDLGYKVFLEEGEKPSPETTQRWIAKEKAGKK